MVLLNSYDKKEQAVLEEHKKAFLQEANLVRFFSYTIYILNYKVMKNFTLLLIITFVLVGCSKTLTYNEAIDRNQKSLESDELKNDAQFLVEAKSLSLIQEELGKLGASSGYAAEIQSYARQITEDHEKMNKRINELASDLKFTVPVEMSAVHRMRFDEVKSSSREDFDKNFLDAVEDIYRSSIDLFESYATIATVNQIRMFSAEYLSLLRKNEEKADELEDDLL